MNIVVTKKNTNRIIMIPVTEIISVINRFKSSLAQSYLIDKFNPEIISK